MVKPLQVMLNVLYYYGMCGVVKELLLKRYFSKVLLWFKLIPFIFVLFRVIQVVIDFEMICQEVRGSAQVPESDIVQACRRVSALELSHFFLLIYIMLLINRNLKTF